MEKLDIKVAEFEDKIEMRCAGRCGGACQCPTGHCKCKGLEMGGDRYEIPSSDTDYFLKVA